MYSLKEKNFHSQRIIRIKSFLKVNVYVRTYRKNGKRMEMNLKNQQRNCMQQYREEELSKNAKFMKILSQVQQQQQPVNQSVGRMEE